MELLPSGTHYLELQHQSRRRRYMVHIPSTGQPPYPVVLAFHGAGGTARIMLHHCRWSHHAELHGFMVVAPQGTPPKPEDKPSFRFNPQLWNLGSPALSAMTQHADDVGFTQALLDALPKQVNIDSERIYCTGFSNGAGLTFLLAAKIGDRFAAISPVAGLPSPQMGNPSRPIPTYCFYSSLDPLVPWNGGEVISPWSDQASIRPAVLETIKRWTQASGFEQQHQNLQASDALEEVQLGKANTNAVMRYTLIHGLGHHWPGGKDVGVPVEILGPRIKTIDATEHIWQFFASRSQK